MFSSLLLSFLHTLFAFPTVTGVSDVKHLQEGIKIVHLLTRSRKKGG